MAEIGTFTSGSVLTAAELNQFNNVTFLYGGSYTLATSTLDYHPFGAGEELLDVSGWHSTSTNTSRITPDVAGWYLVFGSAVLEQSTIATSSRLFVGIYKNRASPSAFSNSVYSPNFAGVTVTGIIEMNGTTDYLEVGVFHTFGTNATISRPMIGCALLRES